MTQQPSTSSENRVDEQDARLSPELAKELIDMIEEVEKEEADAISDPSGSE